MFSSYSSYTFSLGENKTISSALLARAGGRKKKKKSLFGPTANVGLFYRGRCQCSYREFLFKLELRIDFKSRIILLCSDTQLNSSLFRSVKCSS